MNRIPEKDSSMDKAGKGSKRLRSINISILLSGLSVFAQLYLFQPLLPVVAQEFHTTVGDSSLLVSSSTIGMALGLFFFAFKADGYSRKKLMIFSLLTSSVLTMSSAVIHSLPLLVTIGIAKGFILSGVSAVALAYLTEEVDVKVLGIALSLYLSGNTIGGMSGRILATLIAGEIGWRYAVFIIGAESCVLGLIFWRSFPESRFFHPQRIRFSQKLKQMKRFVTDPYTLKLYIIAALAMGVFVSIYNYLTFRLEAPPFELSHYFIAFIFLMYTVGVLGTMLTSKLLNWHDPRKLLKSFILIMLPGIGLLLTEHIYILIFGLGLVTLAFFAAHTMASRMVAMYAQEGKSSSTSIYWLFYYFGSSILGSATGYLLNGTSWPVFIGVLMLAILISFVLSFSGKR